MKLTGYPREWNENEGILPVEVQDLQINASSEELEKLANFLLESARNHKSKQSINASIELPDSRENPQTGIWIQVQTNDKTL